MDTNSQFNDIDFRSREAAQNINVPFDEDAWHKMEALLDKDDRKKAGYWSNCKRNFWLLFLISAGTIAYLLFQLYTIKNTKNTHEDKNKQVNNTQVADNKLVSNYENEQNKLKSAEQSTNQSNQQLGPQENIKNEPKVKTNTAISNKELNNNTNDNDFINNKIEEHFSKQSPINKNIVTPKEILPKEKNKSKSAKKNSEKQNLTPQPQVVKNKIPAVNTTSGFSDTIKTTIDNHNIEQVESTKGKPDLEANNEKTSVENSSTTIESENLLKNDSLGNTLLPNTKDSILTLKNNPNKKSDGGTKKANFLKKMFLSLGTSTEINTVQQKQPNTWTANPYYGIGYVLNNNFCVQIVWSNAVKVYKTDKSAYKFPANSYYNRYDTVNIHANCRFIDVPISLSYQFNKLKKSSVYITAGINLGKLKRETYQYSFKEYGINKLRSSEYTNNAKLTLTNIHVAAGYLLKLTNKIQLFGEGYAYKPTAKVGVGEVKITTLGAKFGLRYSPFTSFTGKKDK